MTKFILHWKGGKTEEVEGDSIADACNRAGIGGGALPALDYYETVKEPPKLSRNQKLVFDYLKEHPGYNSPSEIGQHAGGKSYYQSSSWASPICRRLTELGIVLRNEKGWYCSVESKS